jgi:hypothetical protein
MSDENITVEVPVPELLDVVVTPVSEPVVVVVEDNKENSSDTVISEVIDLAVADATKDMRIAELEAQISDLQVASVVTAEAAQMAMETAAETSMAVEEMQDPVTTSADDAEPRREHGFWRTMRRN